MQNYTANKRIKTMKQELIETTEFNNKNKISKHNNSNSDGGKNNLLRYEKKYVVTELNSLEIETLIKHNPAMFLETFSERKINNIYLDTADLTNYQEHISGISKRLKVRIRWYGETFGLVSSPILEIKIKNNNLGKKLQFDLTPFILNNSFDLELLKKTFIKSKLPAWLNEGLNNFQPTLLNCYRRKYFTSADKQCRITLDKDLNFFKIGNHNNDFNEKIEDKETNILELKYTLNDSERISKITESFPFRQTAFSKYVNGIRKINE